MITLEQVPEVAERMAKAHFHTVVVTLVGRGNNRMGYEACAKLFLPHIIALVGRAKHDDNCHVNGYHTEAGWMMSQQKKFVGPCTCGLTTTIDTINDLFK